MKKLKVSVIDIVGRATDKSWYGYAMRANLVSIMPQSIAVWCEQMGHDVRLAHYTGHHTISDSVHENPDIVFMGAFTSAGHLSYALSNYFRSKGAVTVLGGPHARSYPEDARQYFDYVLGFTDRTVISDILHDCSSYPKYGCYLSADQQPAELPGIQERWKYVDRILQEAPFVKMVPMIGSLGCPYTCSFCIDSTVKYQPLDFDLLKNDLKFLRTKMKRPIVAWHDPNFGIRFNDYLDAIEEAIPPDSIDFIAESSLSLLTEKNVKRMQKNGFKAILPGIESWFDMGNKSRMRKVKGMDKVKRVSEQVNMIMRYIPYFQGNFVLGLDTDEGPIPFELTKKFLDLTPGAFPAYSMLTAFGRAAPLYKGYQEEGRVIPFPFRFLDNVGAMNVKPKNYEWIEFYNYMIDLQKHSFSYKAIYRRMKANRGLIPTSMNILRAISSEGWGKIKYYTFIRNKLKNDSTFRDFFEQESTELPAFYVEAIKADLGPMWEWLPEGGLTHDHNAYKKQPELAVTM